MTDDLVSRFRGEHRNLLWTQLNVDTSYQRDLSPAKVAKITKVFDPDAFGELIVGRRINGTYWIVDGQHRWKAMQQMGWTDQLVPCWVLLGTTPEAEAQLFDLYNGNRGMPRISDRFKARVRHGDPDAIRIKEIVESVGFRLHYGGGSPAKNYVSAISAVLDIHNTGKPGDLLKVLSVLREAWDGEPASINGAMLKAMHRFTSRYRDMLDMQSLTEKLHGTSPAILNSRGRQIAEVMGTTAIIGTSQAILQEYNRHRKQNRLPDWGGDNET